LKEYTVKVLQRTLYRLQKAELFSTKSLLAIKEETNFLELCYKLKLEVVDILVLNTIRNNTVPTPNHLNCDSVDSSSTPSTPTRSPSSSLNNASPDTGHSKRREKKKASSEIIDW